MLEKPDGPFKCDQKYNSFMLYFIVSVSTIKYRISFMTVFGSFLRKILEKLMWRIAMKPEKWKILKIVFDIIYVLVIK